MAVEDLLFNKFVYVEISPKSASSGRTMLYWGVYKGTYPVGERNMIVLENAGHYNSAGVTWGKGRNKTTKLASEKTFLRLDDIISIDVVHKNEE